MSEPRCACGAPAVALTPDGKPVCIMGKRLFPGSKLIRPPRKKAAA